METEIGTHRKFKSKKSIPKIVKGKNDCKVKIIQQNKAKIIIRGLRASSDFEYEFQMSCMNSRLNSTIETVFLPAKDDMHFISSKMIKSVASIGGDVSQFVPKCIAPILTNYYKK